MTHMDGRMDKKKDGQVEKLLAQSNIVDHDRQNDYAYSFSLMGKRLTSLEATVNY